MVNVPYGTFTLAYGEGDKEQVDVWVYDEAGLCWGCTRAPYLHEAAELARAYIDKVLDPVPVLYPRGEAY